jgi:hypothetical protein
MGERSRYQAPRAVQSFEDVSRELRRLQDSLDAATRSGYVQGLQTAALTPLCPSFTRVSPPPTGQVATLPEASELNAGEAVVFHIENPEGPLQIFPAPGQTINGLTVNTFSIAGIVALFSNGVDAWSSTSQIPGGIGPAGTPGAPGSNGGIGPPGLSYSAAMALLAPRAPIPGAAGLPGSAGSNGPPGRMGIDGRQGPPGANGAAGSAGATGAQGPIGPPGRVDYIRTMIPGPPGPTGAAGSGGSGTSALATATVNLGTTPALSGVTTITTSGLTIGQAIPVWTAVDSTDPTDAEEQIAFAGIATSAANINVYWQSVDGTPKLGNKLVAYIPTSGALLSAVGSGNAISVSTQVDLIGSTSNLNITPTSGALGVVDVSTLKCGGVLSFQSVSESTIDGFTAPLNDGFWFILNVRDSTTAAVIKLLENIGATTTSILTPDIRDLRLYKNDSVLMVYSNNRWRCCTMATRLFLLGVDTVTWSAQENNHARTSSGQNHIRVTLTGDQDLTGLVPDQSASGSPNGEIYAISNIDTADTLSVLHESTSSTSGNRFTLPNAKAVIIQPRTTLLFHYDDTTGRSRLLGAPPAGMLHRDTRITTGAWLVTLNPGTTWLRLVGQGGGGGGGGAQNAASLEATAGSGGAAGGYFDIWIQTVSSATQVTGSVGNGGNGGNVAGSAGSAGGNTTITYNGITYTAFGGGGGLGTATGAGAINGGKLVNTAAAGQGGDTDQTDFEIQMGDGFPALMFAGATLNSCMAIGGNGGPSFFGAGVPGAQVVATTAIATPTARGAYGSGGGGAATVRQTAGVATGAAGSNGISGIAIIEQWAGLTPTTTIS